MTPSADDTPQSPLFALRALRTIPSDQLAIALVLILLVATRLWMHGWTQPLLHDRTHHLYLGQLIAQGGQPYIDFLEIHPPLLRGLIALPLVAFPNLQGGAGPAMVHSLLSLIWTGISTVALITIGKRLTGGRLWVGVFAALLWLTVDSMLLYLSSVGSKRLLIICVLLVAVALLQRENWLWAGLVLGAGVMTYYPTLLGGLAFAGSLIAVPPRERLSAVGQYAMGFAVSVGIVVLWMLAAGSLNAWVGTSLRWLLAEIALRAGEGQIINTIISSATEMVSVALANYRIGPVDNSWFPIAGVVGAVGWLVTRLRTPESRRELWRDHDALPPLLTFLGLLAYVLIEHGAGDVFLLQAFFPLWIALGLYLLYQWLMPRAPQFSRVAGAVVVVGLSAVAVWTTITVKRALIANTGPRVRNLTNDRETIDLAAQIEMADTFFSSVDESSSVIVLSHMWLHIVNGSRNPTPIYDPNPLIVRMAEQADLPDLHTELLDLGADAVFVPRGRAGAEYDLLADGLHTQGYVCVGLVHNLYGFAPRNRADMIVAMMHMQQVSPEFMPATKDWRDAIRDPADLLLLDGLDAREIAPGTLLLSHRIQQEEDGPILEMRWWTWLRPKQQTSPITLEFSTPGGTTTRLILNEEPYREDQVILQRVMLPAGASDHPIRLWAETADSPHPCKGSVAHITEIPVNDAKDDS